MKAHPKATPDEAIELIYRQALSRNPMAAELAASRELLGTKPTPDSLSDLLWAIVMLPEFQLVR